MADDAEIKPGFLPPKAPGAGPRPRFDPPPAQPAEPAQPAWQPPTSAPTPAWPPPPTPPTFTRVKPDAPASPMAVTAVVLAAASIVLLVLSLGIGYLMCAMLSSLALVLGVRARSRIRAGVPGRESQARAAIVFASLGLGLAAIAAITWIVLDANGVSPSDLEDWLRRELERREGEQQRRTPRDPDVISAVVTQVRAALRL